MQQLILEELHKLLSCNIIGDKQYNARYKGFFGELDFLRVFEKAKTNNKIISSLYDGGFFLPYKQGGADSLENTAYVTVSSTAPSDEFCEIYKKVSLITQKLFFISYDTSIPFNQWKVSDVMNNGVNVRTPNLTAYHFDVAQSTFLEIPLSDFTALYQSIPKQDNSQKYIPVKTKSFYIQKLKNFDVNDLLNTYVDRYVFDGLIGFLKVKRSDIDSILEKNGAFSLIEIKEKDKSKRSPQGFGMDVHRIESLMNIQKLTSVAYYYIVREIDNQNDRNLVAWKSIKIDKFSKIVEKLDTIEGGTGMRSENSFNPTKVCPYKEFTDLKIFS